MNLHYVFIDNYDRATHIPMHYHNCYEIVYYYHTNGYTTWKHSDKSADDSLVFTDREAGAYKQIDFTDGTVFIIPPNVLHDEKHDTPSRLTAIGFSVHEGDTDYVLLDSASRPMLFRDENGKIRDIIEKIEQMYSQRIPFFEKCIGSLVSSIFAILFSDEKADPKIQSIQHILRYIDEHFTAPLNVVSLAQQIGYCPDYFRVLFKQYTGKAPKEYILTKRLDFACRLLRDSDYTVEAIGLLCGFQNCAQFNKFFKQKMGTPPHQYRTANK